MALLDDKYKRSRGLGLTKTGLKVKEGVGGAFTSNHTQPSQIESIETLQSLKSAKTDVIKNTNTIKGIKLITANEVVKVLSLDKEQGIGGILISHHFTLMPSVEIDAIFSLVWSEEDASELTIPVSSGVIETTSATGGAVFRIITTLMPSNSSFMIPSDLLDKFESVDKKINFFASSSIEGVEMTIFTK